MKDIQVHARRAPRAFTLVEILVVITIIGILAGIAIPAVTSALRTSREAAIRVEINVVSQALEAYKLKYGDYPPDFFDWRSVETHFRKAFPNIDNNELRILAQFTHYNSMMERTGEASGSPPADPRTSTAFDHYPHSIDRAEALVLCLGGFSSDKKRPFTGQGGPLVKISTAPAAEPNGDFNDYLFYQYNSERESGFFDFDQPNLSLKLHEGGNGPLNSIATASSVYVYTTDEDHAGIDNAMSSAPPLPISDNFLGLVYRADPFPTYSPPGSDQPLVYFNSRDYNMAWGSGATYVWNPSGSQPRSHHLQNVYLPSGPAAGISDTGLARPYTSNVVDTTPPTSIEGMPVSGTVLQFAENDKFQVVSAGLDSNYGGVVGPPGTWGPGSAGIAIYPSGQYYNPLPLSGFTPAGPYASVSSVDKFQDDLCLKTHYAGTEIYRSQPQLDNVTNFTTRTFQSDLP